MGLKRKYPCCFLPQRCIFKPNRPRQRKSEFNGTCTLVISFKYKDNSPIYIIVCLFLMKELRLRATYRRAQVYPISKDQNLCVLECKALWFIALYFLATTSEDLYNYNHKCPLPASLCLIYSGSLFSSPLSFQTCCSMLLKFFLDSS